MEPFTVRPVGEFTSKGSGTGVVKLASWLKDEKGECFSGLEVGRRIWLIFKLETTEEWTLSKQIDGKTLGVFAGRVQELLGDKITLSDCPQNLPENAAIMDMMAFAPQTDYLPKTASVTSPVRGQREMDKISSSFMEAIMEHEKWYQLSEKALAKFWKKSDEEWIFMPCTPEHPRAFEVVTQKADETLQRTRVECTSAGYIFPQTTLPVCDSIKALVAAVEKNLIVKSTKNPGDEEASSTSSEAEPSPTSDKSREKLKASGQSSERITKSPKAQSSDDGLKVVKEEGSSSSYEIVPEKRKSGSDIKKTPTEEKKAIPPKGSRRTTSPQGTGKETTRGKNLFGLFKKGGKASSDHPSTDLERLPPPPAGTLLCRQFQDLPPQLQEIVSKANVPTELSDEKFKILLNILHFKTKYDIKNTAEDSDEAGIFTESRAVTGKKLDANNLITPGDPRKLFKMAGLAGKGGFGRVFKATPKKGKTLLVAIKRMPHQGKKEVRKNLEEVHFLKACQHPNIVTLIDAYIAKDELWIVTEFMEGGTLAEAVRGFDFKPEQIAYIAQEILKALAYLHGREFIHRDLKSANIMMTVRGDIKLIDFGLCVDISDKRPRRSMAGSPFWMPPEMIRRKAYTTALDIWSFGICLMELANSHPPNRGNSVTALWIAATEGNQQHDGSGPTTNRTLSPERPQLSDSKGYPDPLENPDRWPAAFLDFLRMCLQVNPKKRWNVAQLQKHPFLSTAEDRNGMEKLKVLTWIFMKNAIALATFV